MTTKIQKKSKKYCGLGGIFHIQDVFCGILSNVIDKVLGQRGETAKAYKYSEIVISNFVPPKFRKIELPNTEWRTDRTFLTSRISKTNKSNLVN